MKRAVLLFAAFLACGKAKSPPLPSDGCANPTVTAGSTTGSIDVGGTARTYVLFVPDGDPKRPRSLVFGFHGAGGNGSQARLYYLNLETPAAGSAIIVYPDGLPDSDGSTGWPNTNDQDIAMVDALIAKMEAEACVDKNRIFATGFSYGGFMSNTVGCERAGVVRAIAPLSGGGPFGKCNGKTVAVWISQGAQDPRVTPDMGAGSRDYWRNVNGCGDTPEPVDPSPCVGYLCSSGDPVVYCEFQGDHQVPTWVGPAVMKFFGGM